MILKKFGGLPGCNNVSIWSELLKTFKKTPKNLLFGQEP